MWNEIKRKLFHLTALIYVLGVVYLPRLVYLQALVVILILVALFEFLRLRNPIVRKWVIRHFGSMLRESEMNRPSGVFWMLLGVMTTVALLRPVPLACTALLYLILGDGIASLVGMRVGGPHWPGSKRRLSGSAACFLVCLFVGMILIRPAYSWCAVLAGAVGATAAEVGVIPFNDNFSIPAVSSIILLLTYRLSC